MSFSNTWSSRRKRQALVAASACLLALASTPPGALCEEESSGKLIRQALKQYRAGNYDKAAAILARDLSAHPEDGMTHYYLGLVKQKLGDDGKALEELELAARFCPPEVIGALTKQVIDESKNELPGIPVIKPPKIDWMTAMGMNVATFFGAPKPKVQPETSPDFMAPFDDMMRQGKKWYRQATGKAKKDGVPYQVWSATSMPLEDMLMLVDKSRAINDRKWASHSDGVVKYRQAPENTPDWDYWIRRYKRAFQYVLIGHLARDAKNQVSGSAACIFSIDNKGNLRGHIYASTGDDTLNNALVKTIRDMNHSRVLVFPSSTKVTGYNFRMTWNYGRLLSYIRYVRAYRALVQKQAEAAKLAKLEAEAKAKVEAELLKAKKLKEEQAKQKKLLAEKERARVAAQLVGTEFKTEVTGLVLPPTELEAVALKLSDAPVKNNKAGRVQRSPAVDRTESDDIFSTIDDKEIMSWPDINR